MLAWALPEDLGRVIWDYVAFLGRYGKQPADVVLQMTLREIDELAAAVARLMREEQPKPFGGFHG